MLDPVERDAVSDKPLEAEVGGLGAGDDGRLDFRGEEGQRSAGVFISRFSNGL